MEVVVHGGAGSTPDEPAARQAVLEEAAEVGAVKADPLDAVEAAVAVLEESPRFNAGRGGTVQADGVVRTDAGVMTNGRQVGAVCSLTGVVRTASVARFVLDRTPHVLVSGDQARRLAERAGVETGVDLLTDATRQRFAAASPPDPDTDALLEWVGEHFGSRDGAPADHDTVGAVAVTESGALAAATSTGGRWFAWPGRVGDTPQVGAGYYASAVAGASATGWGEDIARVTLCRDVVGRVEAGTEPQLAAERAVAMLDEETGGCAGIIVADRDGTLGIARNTETMQTATARG